MINNAVIMGRIVADPELRTTANGTSVTSFTVAVDRRFNKQGEERQADFIDIVAWRNTAEHVCKYFAKGSMIAIQGNIQTRMFEDKNGNKRKAVEIVAENVSFCGSKSDNANTASEPATVADVSIDDGDFREIPEDCSLPF
jgi:single-strand DNA-binding protein